MQELIGEHTMRAWRLDVSRRRSWPTLVALLVVVVYAGVAFSAQLGANIAGQGLDPVWAAAQQRGVLRVATDFGYAPFTEMRREFVGGVVRDQPAGFDIDLARAVAEKLGLQVEFVPTSLESAYETLASDRADVVISALPYAPEQGWRATFSSFYFNAGQVLVVREDSPITSAAQLDSLRVGVALGSDADTLARSLPRLHLRASYDTPALALADLRRGALDAVLTDNAAALITLNSAPGLRFVPPALTLEPYAIGMSNRAFLLRERVNIALEALRGAGWFERKTVEWFR